MGRLSITMARRILLVAACCYVARAFSSPLTGHQRTSSRTALSSSNNGREEEPNPASELTRGLTSQLRQLNRNWEMEQLSQTERRWTELYIESDSVRDVGIEVGHRPTDNLVYLLEPPNKTRPSCLIVFVGGAGLGQFPHIAYNEFLVRVSNRLNAAVIAAPYQISLDHFSLSKRVGELVRKAIIKCQDDATRLYPENLPTYCLAHSLGCKLASIYIAATGHEFDGVGFMCFNNFGFRSTIAMARELTERLGSLAENGRPLGSFSRDQTREIFNRVFGLAEATVSAIGLDFTPTPRDTERLIQLKFDANQVRKTRLFTFDDDTMENTQDFINACSGEGPEVSGLPGNHLTPVFFKLGVDQLPEEMRDMARDSMGGIESASFGSEEELDTIVTEVCDWILGKGPSRPPKWQREQPLLTNSSGVEES